MKKLKLFSLLLLLFIGVGQVWATEVEVISTLNTTSNITLNATATNVNNVLSITGTKGTNNFPVFNYNATKGVDLRFYSGSTCAVTFTVASGYKLDGIIFKKNTTTASSISNLTANNGTLSNNSWTAGDKTQSVKFTYNSNSNFKEQIYLIYVTYSVDGGSEDPTI